tara:strand:+ start:158 stop:400 length:243 start_codon:yes stop_codon:yes gene_type:complete
MKDDPTLGDPDKIRMFAGNALTTTEMLQFTYLNYINREETLRGLKKKMRKSNYTLTRNVSHFYSKKIYFLFYEEEKKVEM